MIKKPVNWQQNFRPVWLQCQLDEWQVASGKWQVRVMSYELEPESNGFSHWQVASKNGSLANRS